MKKGIKFLGSSVLNLILFFNLLNILKCRDKMKQAKRIRYFTTEDTVTEWNAPVKPANKYFVAILWTNIPCTVYVVVIECYSFLCVI